MENLDVKQRLETLLQQKQNVLSKIEKAAENYAKLIVYDANKDNHEEYYVEYGKTGNDELVRLANIELAIKACNDILKQ